MNYKASKSFGPSELPSDLQNTINRLRHVGENVYISDKAVFYNPENISIEDNSRIDDFAILSAGKGGIEIGRYVHIACNTTIQGQGRVILKDFSAISSRVAIYSSSDPYDGSYMTNPCIPEFSKTGIQLRKTYHEDVYLGKHVVVGTGSTILPGAFLSYGCSVGAMSLILGKVYNAHSILVGVPAKLLKIRENNIDKLEKELN
jgi:dTDP-4-amino-4,6-dideoxy-D-glucose acyltransferase